MKLTSFSFTNQSQAAGVPAALLQDGPTAYPDDEIQPGDDYAVSLSFRGGDAWDRMYEDCLRAEKSIEFEQYILRDDHNGRRFLTLFAQKAEQGIEVRLLFDRIGCRQIFGLPLLERIRAAGGKVVFYNPVGWPDLFSPQRWFPRNHIKALLIDSQIAHIGSVCLADYMHDWREMHARVTGDPVEGIERDFASIWGRVTRKHTLLPPPRSQGKKINYSVARPGISSPIYHELLRQVLQARTSIYIGTPYFLAPGPLRRALRDAVGRGVDVRIIVTNHTDVPLAVHVSRSYFTFYLRDGLKLFSYRPGMYHAKYAVIDRQWAMLGSTNIDYLSLLRNRESNLLIHDPLLITQLQNHFYEDLSACEPVDEAFLRRAPLFDRIFGYMGRLIKRMI